MFHITTTVFYYVIIIHHMLIHQPPLTVWVPKYKPFFVLIVCVHESQ